MDLSHLHCEKQNLIEYSLRKGKYYFNFPFKLLKFRNLPQCGPKLQRKSFMEPAPGTFFPTTADLESHYGARKGVDARWRNWHGPNRKCWPNGP